MKAEGRRQKSEIAAVLFFSAFCLLPSAFAANTDWMRPDASHLTIGMARAEAIAALRAWNPQRGADDGQVVVDFSGDRAATLQFRDGRLVSVRFELFVLLPETRKAFAGIRKQLRAARGAPRRESESVLVYDTALPNVFVAVNDDPASESGRRGVGILAVRYFDPR
jgi:hypothetical protein